MNSAVPNFSDFFIPCSVAVGNEADGLSHGLLTGADSCVRTEMFETVESLNFAVTIGIVLHAMAVEELASGALGAGPEFARVQRSSVLGEL